MAASLTISLDGPNALRLIGDLDMATEAGLRAALLILSGPVRLNMADVTFMDSTALHVILSRMALTPVRVEAASPSVRTLFALMGVETLADGQLTGRSGNVSEPA